MIENDTPSKRRNYTFPVQDAAKLFDWNNLQALVHHIIDYFKSSPNELSYTNNVYISDNLSHNQRASLHNAL